jgi:hypothetical protein
VDGNDIQKVLVPFDNSSYSEKALNLATILAKDFNAQLFILNVVEEIPSSVRMERNSIRSAVTGEMVGVNYHTLNSRSKNLSILEFFTHLLTLCGK